MSDSRYKIYPKEYLNSGITVKKNTCFVIMSFKKQREKLFGEIKSNLSAMGITCNRADEFKSDPIIISSIIKGIVSSEYVITDITEESANVFYELGIAHSFKDATNVIIIKEKDSKCPFDLSHIRYIEYQMDNMFLLNSNINDRIVETKGKQDFLDAIIVNGIIDNLSINNEDFLNYLFDSFENYIHDITSILSKSNQLSDDEIENVLNSLEMRIRELEGTSSCDYLAKTVKLYCKILVSAAYSKAVEKHLNEFVIARFHSQEQISWTTNLMIMLAKDKQLFKLSMDWIINYFKKPRAATIDLNRYSLERFLMLSEDDDVDNNIIDSLYSESARIREFMADIIGEKRIEKAVPVLFNKLESEYDNYALRSYFHAISKISKNDNDVLRLLLWLKTNEKRFVDNKDYFLFNHFHDAIKRMDVTNERKYLNEFEEKFGNYITE